MSFKSVELPEDFYNKIKSLAQAKKRTIVEELEYLVSVEEQKDLRQWQVQKMHLGLEQVKQGKVISHEEVLQKLKAL
jgi:predicted transcriptional regulator